jgi:hypothetical protein
MNLEVAYTLRCLGKQSCQPQRAPAKKQATPSKQLPQGNGSQPQAKPQSITPKQLDKPIGSPDGSQPISPQNNQSPQSKNQDQDQDNQQQGTQPHEGLDQVLQALGFVMELLKQNGIASYFKEGHGITTTPQGNWQHFENGQHIGQGSGEATLSSYLSSKPGMNPKSELPSNFKQAAPYQQNQPQQNGGGNQPPKSKGFPISGGTLAGNWR